MNDLQQRFTTAHQQVIRKQGQKDILLDKQHTVETKLTQLQESIVLYTDVKKLLELFSKTVEVRTREYLEPLVTEALDFVFSQGLQFHLMFVNRRNQIEVDFIILRNADAERLYQKYILEPEKHEKKLELLVKMSKHINSTYGGAVNQVLALVLRLLLVELLKIKGPVVLDEPSSAVGEEYSSRLGQLITSFSQRFNRQYVLITHSKTLASFADRLYNVSKVNDISHITEET